MTEIERLDRFLDALAHDPAAMPPPDLDEGLAACARDLARSQAVPRPASGAEARVWARVLETAVSASRCPAWTRRRRVIQWYGGQVSTH